MQHTGPASFLGDAKDLLTSWENRRARRFAKQRREIMLDKEPRGTLQWAVFVSIFWSVPVCHEHAQHT